MGYESQVLAAVAAVRRACVLSRQVQNRFRRESDSISKTDASPVTVADFAVQALVIEALTDGNAKFIAEESSAQLAENPPLLADVAASVNAVMPDDHKLSLQEVCDAIDRGSHPGGDGKMTWVLDPIDGTKGFIRLEQYCIALGLLDAGEVQVGVLGCPNLPFDDKRTGCIFYAERGRGALCVSVDEPRVTSEVIVSPTGDTVSCRFMESVESAHSSFATSAQVASALGVREAPVRMDSQCKYGALARGDGQIYMRFPRAGYEENIWDHAAGSLVIEEAGGKVTDGTGQKLDFGIGRKLHNVGGIVATNGQVHEAVVKAVRDVLGL